jgi:hypothetical protein
MRLQCSDSAVAVQLQCNSLCGMACLVTRAAFVHGPSSTFVHGARAAPTRVGAREARTNGRTNGRVLAAPVRRTRQARYTARRATQNARMARTHVLHGYAPPTRLRAFLGVRGSGLPPQQCRNSRFKLQRRASPNSLTHGSLGHPLVSLA